jgi:hypothetical protein
MFSRSILAAAIVAASAAIAHAQTAPAPAPTPAPAAPTPAAPLTGLQAWVALVGNTVSGKVDGKDYVDYYMADGTVKTMEGSQLSTGKWSLEGPQVCFKYPREQRDCYTMEVVGKVVTFKSKDGTGLRFDILEGNAKNL